MTVSTIAPIRAAVVRTLRFGHGPRSYVYPEGHDLEGVQALTGKWLFDGFAPAKKPYPFITYQFLPSSRSYPWGSVMTLAAVDVKAFSTNSVEADNLFALCASVLDDALLEIAGQTSLICRRVADLGGPDVDEEGQKIFMVGGTYLIWTDQPLSRRIEASFTVDAVVS